MWTDYFRLIKLRRGRVITPSHGEIDFSRDDIGMKICKELFDRGFPYLELTELGEAELYLLIPDAIGEIIPIPEKCTYCNPIEELPQKYITIRV